MGFEEANEFLGESLRDDFDIKIVNFKLLS